MKSPFEVSKKNENEPFLKKIFTAFENSMMFNIPSEAINRMPRRYLFWFGFILKVSLLFLFLFFLITGYLSRIKQAYLSPSSQSTDLCSSVPISNTGVYLADSFGIWEGQYNFTYALSLYEFTAVNFITSNQEFASRLDDLYFLLQDVGDKMQINNIAVNILVWTSYVAFFSSQNFVQKFSMEASALTIFDQDYLVGSIASVWGTCPAKSISSFDSSNGIVSIEYSYSEYMSYEQCRNASSPELLGYMRLATNDVFSLKFDIRSLVTAVAINIGIVTVGNLQQISSLDQVYHYKNISYLGVWYVDPRYPGMEPVLCVTQNGTSYCSFNFGSVLAIPLLEHRGNSSFSPVYCNCSTLNADTMNRYSNCNLFEFIYGFLFWNTADPTPIMAFYHIYDPYYVSPMAFNASFAGSYWGVASNNSLLTSSEFLVNSYEFCVMDGFGSCSLLLFSSFDGNMKSWAVSQFQYQLFDGSCSNSISIPYSYWQILENNPFTPLENEYVNCNASSFQAGVTSLGVANGVVAASSPLIIIALLSLVFLYSKLTQSSIPSTYTHNEKAQALDSLAVCMLLARDEQVSKEDVQDVLYKLVDSLRANANADIYRSNPYDSHVDWKGITKLAKDKITNPMVYAPNNVNTEPAIALTSRTQAVDAELGSLRILNSDFSTFGSEFVSIKEAIEFFNQILCDLNEAKISPLKSRMFWEVITRTGRFKSMKMSMLNQCVNDQDGSILLFKLESIMILHACNALAISEERLKSDYGEVVAYAIEDGVMTLRKVELLLARCLLK